MKLFAAILTVFVSLFVNAQSSTDEEQVKQAINRLFDGMRKTDSLLAGSAFAPGARLQTVAVNREGKVSVKEDRVDQFLRQIGTPHEQVYDERIVFESIKIDGNLAMAWTPYKFFISETYSHCGVNLFQLVKLEGEWKIISIIDTRRKENCP